MSDLRGDVDVETLLKIVLVLMVAWIALEIVGGLVDAVFGILQPIVVILVVILIVLWLLDEI